MLTQRDYDLGINFMKSVEIGGDLKFYSDRLLLWEGVLLLPGLPKEEREFALKQAGDLRMAIRCLTLFLNMEGASALSNLTRSKKEQEKAREEGDETKKGE